MLPTNKRFVDITGQTFHHLKAIRYVGRDERSRQLWEFECVKCGAVVTRLANSVKTGRVRACGCQQFAGNRRTHGRHGTHEYRIWRQMRQRCNNPNAEGYANYGGRGITVCERWNDFANFLADMGEAPSPDHTIERKDNAGPYDPENCCWATRADQSRNKRDNHLVTYQGQTLPLIDWAAKLGINYYTLHTRIHRRGWSVEKAFTTMPAK